MSRSIVQPVGQKRLTNVAVVRLKKDGNRFEIACYKNMVLSWRNGSVKDLDEVLQSQTVYSNVSKGVLAKSKDLLKSFGTDDQKTICLEILEKGELQVAGKERESQLSSQFRDIATIVMQKTINPETERPYTISMIERLMHEIHFAIDPHKNSKQQALDVIRKLEKSFPIKRAPMKLKLVAPSNRHAALMEKLTGWNASILSKEESSDQASLVCEIEPSLFRDCQAFVTAIHGRWEVLSVSVHAEGDADVDHYNEPDELPSASMKGSNVIQLSEELQSSSLSAQTKVGEAQVKRNRCNTCDAVFGDAKEFREHHKSEWHNVNVRRKAKKLPPLSQEDCLTDIEASSSKDDLKEYSF